MRTRGVANTLILAVALLLAFGFAQPASAQLAAVGPVDPVTGFPTYFTDAAGGQVQLCDEGGAVAEEPPCLPELIEPASGFVAGNIGEALFYAAVAEFTTPAGESILAQCVIEAAGPGPGAVGDTVANAALIRLRGLTVAGNYTIETPCGTFGPIPFDPAVDGTEIRSGPELTSIGVLADVPSFSGARPAVVSPETPVVVELFASNGTGAPGFLGDGITFAPLSGPLQTGGPTAVTVSGAISATSSDFLVVGKVANCGPDNLPPLANDDFAAILGGETAINVVANDVDDQERINFGSIAITVAPTLGTAVPNMDGTVTYTPNAGASGVDTFTYTVLDACGLPSNPAIVTLFLEPAETLAAAKADYRSRTGKWLIEGTSDLVEPIVRLSGAEEVPAVTTNMGGYALVNINEAGTAIEYDLMIDRPADSAITMAHIHIGARGTNGPVIFWLCNTSGTPPGTIPVPPLCPTATGTAGGTLTELNFVPAGNISTFAEALAAIRAGNTYVNVHTGGVPSGEIRGQIGNFVNLRAGTSGIVGNVVVQPDQSWIFEGKSIASPGVGPHNINATSTQGEEVIIPLRLR
ncbi:MAG: CHRD domain-containing protein [Trichloromonadaceae bacterium]